MDKLSKFREYLIGYLTLPTTPNTQDTAGDAGTSSRTTVKKPLKSALRNGNGKNGSGSSSKPSTSVLSGRVYKNQSMQRSRSPMNTAQFFFARPGHSNVDYNQIQEASDSEDSEASQGSENSGSLYADDMEVVEEGARQGAGASRSVKNSPVHRTPSRALSSSSAASHAGNKTQRGKSAIETASASTIRSASPSRSTQAIDMSQITIAQPDSASSRSPSLTRMHTSQSTQQQPQNPSDEELVVQSGVDDEPEKGSFFDYNAVRESVHRKCQKMRADGFTEDEISFYTKLELRGVQSMLPFHWHIHFPSLPGHIFTATKEEQYFNAQTASEFRAILALQTLITMGGRVRDVFGPPGCQERAIIREITRYTKWAACDGGYDNKRIPPFLVVHSAHDSPSAGLVIDQMLAALAVKHRQRLAHPNAGERDENGDIRMFTVRPPVLWGIVVIQSFVVMVSWDSGASPEQTTSTNVAQFDFNKADMDVWNAYAIAIMCVMIRNKMMEVADEFESDNEVQEDPDA